jgi:hypothetical protein
MENPMDEETGSYGGYAIIDFKKEAIKAGETPPAAAGEISVSMLGTVAMLRVVSPSGDVDEWAPTLVAHIRYTDSRGVTAYLERQQAKRSARFPRAAHMQEQTA